MLPLRASVRSVARGVTAAGVVVILAACGPDAPTVSPPVALSAAPAAPSGAAFEAARAFRLEHGLRADPAWLELVANDPTSSAAEYGVPLLWAEIQDLESRALRAEDALSIVEEYGGAHANTFAGAYLDSKRGVVVALFAGPTEVHQLALSGLFHPAAQIDVRSARFSLISLQAVEDEVRAAAAQLRAAGIRIGSSTVNVPDNRVWVGVGSLDPSALARVAAIGPSGTILASWDDFLLAELPRGSLTGRVIDGGGAPLADLEVRLTGDVASYEPDGGVAYSTDGDGRFTIPRLAAMGWSVDVMQTVPDRAVVVVGHVHATVEAGRPTVITIIASPFSGTTSGQLTTDERVRPLTGYSRIRIRSSSASTQSLGLGG